MNRPVRRPRARSSVWIIRAVEVLPLVPVTWITGYERCGSPSRPVSSLIRSSDGSIECSGVRTRICCSTSRSSSLARASGSRSTRHAYREQAAPRGALPGGRSRPARRPAGPGSWSPRRRAPSRNDGLPSLRCDTLGILAGGGQLLVQPPPLGGDVDRRRTVQPDGDALGLDEAFGPKPSAGSVEPQQRADRGLVRRERRRTDPGADGRAPAARAAVPGQRGTCGPRSPAASATRARLGRRVGVRRPPPATAPPPPTRRRSARSTAPR